MVSNRALLPGDGSGDCLERSYEDLLRSLDESVNATQWEDQQLTQRFAGFSSEHVRRNRRENLVVHWNDIQLPNALASDSLKFYLSRLLLMFPPYVPLSVHRKSFHLPGVLKQGSTSVQPEDAVTHAAFDSFADLVATVNPSSCEYLVKAVLRFLSSVRLYRLNTTDSHSTNVLYAQLLNLRRNCTAEAGPVRALISSCLLGLAVAFGSQELLLTTSAELLNPLFDDQPKADLKELMVVPHSYLCMERCIFERLLGIYDWISSGLKNDLMMLSVDFPNELQLVTANDISLTSFAVDLSYIYVLVSLRLHKLGSGFGGSVAGHLYLSREIPADSWKGIFCHNSNLYVKSTSKIVKLNKETLEIEAEVIVSSLVLSSLSHLASNGSSLRLLHMGENSEFRVAELNDDFDVISDEAFSFGLQMLSFGQKSDLSVIKAEEKFTVACKDIIDIRCSNQSIFVLTRQGRILFTDLDETGEAKAVWRFLQVPYRFTKMTVSRGGNCTIVTTGEGECVFIGTLIGEVQDYLPFETEKCPSGKDGVQCVKLKSAVRECACSGDYLCIITDDKLYLLGRNNQSFDCCQLRFYSDLKPRELDAAFICESQLLLKTNGGRLLTFDIEKLLGKVCDADAGTSERPLLSTSLVAPSSLVSRETIIDQVCCGQNHVVAVTNLRALATMGSNEKGQLGIGTLESVTGIQFPAFDDPSLKVKMAAAGNNHTAVLMTDGLVYTFGEFANGQLGRQERSESAKVWYAVPGKVALPPNVQNCVVRKVFAFGSSTVLAIEQNCAQWLGGDIDVSVSSTVNGCFIFGADQQAKLDSYLIVDCCSRNVEAREESPVALTLSHVSCFDAYNALWRLDTERRRFMCFLPRTERCSESVKKTTTLCYDDPVTYVPYTENKASSFSVGLNILRVVHSLSETQGSFCGAQGQRTGRDSCFDACYRAVRCKAIMQNCHWCCDDGKCDEALEFKVDRDVFLFGIGIFGGAADYTAQLKIGRSTAADYMDNPDQVVTAAYSCLPGDTFDVALERPMLLKKDTWYRVSAEFSPTCGDGCDDRDNKVVGEDGTTFYFRNVLEEFNVHVYLKSYQFPKLIYLPAYLFDPETFDVRRHICDLLWNVEKRLLENLSLSTAFSIKLVVKLLKQASLAIVGTNATNCAVKDGDLFYRYKVDCLCNVMILCSSILNRFFKVFRSQVTSSDYLEGKSYVPDILVVINQAFALARSDTRSKRFQQLKKQLSMLLQNYFELFFTTLAVSRLIDQYQDDQPQSKELLAFLVGFAGAQNPLKLVYGASIADQCLDTENIYSPDFSDKVVKPSALFRFTSLLTSRLCTDGHVAEELADAICDFVYRVLYETASLTTEPKEDGCDRFYSVCRFRSPKTEDWHCGSAQPDAIQFKVDRSVVFHGFAVHVKNFQYEYSCQFRPCQKGSDAELLDTLMVSGAFSGTDCANGIFKMLFRSPVLLCPNREYVLVLMLKGPSCFGGSSGQHVVEGPDGSKFSFSQSCLSRNGTGIDRGLLSILFYSLPDITTTLQFHVLEMRCQFWQWVELFFAALQAHVDKPSGRLSKSVVRLCGQAMPLIAVFVNADLIQLKGIIRTAGRLLQSLHHRKDQRTKLQNEERLSTTSFLAHVVESEHPYVAAGVQNYHVKLPDACDFIAVEFDERCKTRQPEDRLDIAIHSADSEPIMVGPFSENNFPKHAIFIPGHAADIRFATATFERGDGDDEDNAGFGFKCYLRKISVTNPDDVYDWLEKEVTSLLSYVASAFFWYANDIRLQLNCKNRQESLINSEIAAAVPKDSDLRIPLKDITQTGLIIPEDLDFTDVFRGAGFFDWRRVSSYSKFLLFPVNHIDLTSLEFCRWLIDKPFIDPVQCKFFINTESNKKNQLLLHLILFDQYGSKVFLSDLDVRVIALSVSKASGAYDCASDPHGSFHSFLKPFSPSFHNRLRFQNLCMQPQFETLSFEELRLQMYGDGRRTFVLRMQTSNGNLYSALWSPSEDGFYRLFCFIDGVEFQLDRFVQLSKQRTVLTRNTLYDKEIFDPPRMAVCCSNSKEHRVAIRSVPSLTRSAVIGYVPLADFFCFRECVSNEDGCWIRVPLENAVDFCPSLTTKDEDTEAWCLQYDAASQTSDFVTMPLYGFRFAGKNQKYVSYEVDFSEVYYSLDKAERIEIRNRPTFSSSVIEKFDASQNGGRPLFACRWLCNDEGIWVQVTFTEEHLSFPDTDTRHSQRGFCCVLDRNFRRYLRPVRSMTVVKSGCSASDGGESRGDAAVVLQPSTVSSVAAVFAAFLHKKNITDDFLACLLCLNANPHLWLKPDTLKDDLPSSAMALFKKVFEQICVEITTVSQQQIMMPLRWSSIQATSSRIAPSENFVRCELCEEHYAGPFFEHMKSAHPGCMVITYYAYDSKGVYDDSYSGDIEDICGYLTDEYYVMCLECRNTYLKTKKGNQHLGAKKLKFNVFPDQNIFCSLRFISNVLLTTDSGEETHSPTEASEIISTISEDSHAKADDTDFRNLSTALSRRGAASVRSSCSFFCPSNSLKPMLADQQAGVSEFMKILLSSCFYFGDMNELLELLRISAYSAVLYEHGFKFFLWLLEISSHKEVALNQLNFLLMECRNEPWRKLVNPARFEFVPHAVKTRLVSLLSSLLDSVLSLVEKSPGEDIARLCCRIVFSDLFASSAELMVKKDVLKSTLSLVFSNGIEGKLRQEDANSWDVVESEKLTKNLKICVSSQKALEAFLLDGKTDTFWESDKADLTSWKQIYVQWGVFPQLDLELSFYVDNKRDNETQVNGIAVLVREGKSVFKPLKTKKIKPSFSGWIAVDVTGYSEARIKLYGEQLSLRVKQLCLIGTRRGHFAAAASSSKELVRKTDSTGTSMLRKDVLSWCNTFYDRLVTDTVDLPVDVQEAAVGDILFLLDQVVEKQLQISCAHDEQLADLLRIVLKVIKVPCAQEVLERNRKFLLSISALLLLGTEVVQTSALELLTEAIDLSDSVCWGLVELIQNLLKTFAKVLMVRCTTQPETTFTVSNSLVHATGWFVDGKVSQSLASQLSTFILRLKAGEHGENFAKAMKGVLLNSTKEWFSPAFVETFSLKVAVQKPEFWLSLASLFHLSPEDVVNERSHVSDEVCSYDIDSQDSQGSSESITVFCENHDDSRTLAETYCLNCRMHLCSNCCSVLHLSGSKRGHEFQQSKTSKNQLVVRNAYVRLRVEDLVLVIDKDNYNVVLNFRTGAAAVPGSPLSGSRTPEWKFCHKLLACGHLCGGFEGEEVCMPCLICADMSSTDQDEDDVCIICFWERLNAAPSIRLSCGHVFHYHCCQNSLKKKWYGPRISFSFMTCPLCRKAMDHPLLKPLLEPLNTLKSEIEDKALKRLDFDGLKCCPEVTEPHARFYNDPVGLAMQKYAYYQCFKCHKSYFGGTAECLAGQPSTDYDPAELVCGGCSNLAAATVCPRHGAEYLQYKCRYCCSIAVFFCFGTTHFCAKCHDHHTELTSVQLSKLPQCPVGPLGQHLPSCPLKVPHPPSGIEFPLGCSLCSYTKDF